MVSVKTKKGGRNNKRTGIKALALKQKSSPPPLLQVDHPLCLPLGTQYEDSVGIGKG